MANTVEKHSESDHTKFHHLLREQVGHEFAAAQQYLAIAVWYDGADLPRLAAHFYRQALEERNHALMIVQYLMDKDVRVSIPGVSEVRNDFTDAREPVELALHQEETVTEQIVTLAKTARDEGDYIGEQFLQWFLKEQVEEVASMRTLLAVVDRADGNLFHVEAYLTRESVGEAADPSAPRAAGGAL
ncbi:ferritin [Saccharothrix violaceirubra]|uniref:Ferritin n=1 Tax=Saccharothrix violaceirubra TaxID=413306 RepID=A0A7W7TAT2_9PSEU|nr:ferritin [Saccharothrix violaceirubra]MBB4969192.1 ferritin [Saccharothrix violaceirubra]